jgi:predicted small metal-binding protein
MAISIGCKELGIDCPFKVKGETEEGVLDAVMRHMHAEHEEKIEGWFDIEEIYQSALKAIREKAA